MISAANLAVAAEGLVMGVKAGLDPDTMLEVINAGTGQNSATMIKIPNHILTRGFDYGGSLAISLKDLDAFLREAASLSMDTPLGRAIQRAYQEAAAGGVEGLDMTTVIRPMEQRVGVEVSGKR
jgi:3-hydroxyisobutyrate dehydrogenase-like beta-hydroxyacid dehydrogenase